MSMEEINENITQYFPKTKLEYSYYFNIDHYKRMLILNYYRYRILFKLETYLKSPESLYPQKLPVVRRLRIKTSQLTSLLKKIINFNKIHTIDDFDNLNNLITMVNADIAIKLTKLRLSDKKMFILIYSNKKEYKTAIHKLDEVDEYVSIKKIIKPTWSKVFAIFGFSILILVIAIIDSYIKKNTFNLIYFGICLIVIATIISISLPNMIKLSNVENEKYKCVYKTQKNISLKNIFNNVFHSFLSLWKVLS